jgi:hypothetical protein
MKNALRTGQGTQQNPLNNSARLKPDAYIIHTVDRFTFAGNLLLPLIPLIKIKLAEGVVSEPFLPPGDQGHKGGFATLQKWSKVC